nr:SCO-spondin-like [Lytechinus pictus]
MVFEGSSLCNGATCLNDGDCRGDQKCCFDMMCGGTESRCMSAPQIHTGLIPPEIHPGVCPGDVGATPMCDGALCIHDGECGPGEKCCSSASCAEGLRCMPAPQIQPPVVVPGVKPRFGSCPTLGVNCDGQECLSDGDCFDNEKCCEADCGSRCTIPVIAPPPPPEIHLGQCPSVEAEGACDNPLCLHDGNCATSERCCVSACGYHCTPAIPLAPNLGPPQCSGDLVFNRCAVTCELTCDNPNPRPCTRECGIGCYCPEGTIRESENSHFCFPDVSFCLPPNPGPEPLGPKACSGDLVYNECGSACEMTCENPEPQMCIKMCRPGCFCPSDTIRLSPDSDTCLPFLMDAAIQDTCPETGPAAPPLINLCPGDLVYTECGSGCERTCDNPDPEMCTEECRSGCFCPGFTVRRSTDSDTCFPILMDVGLQVSCQDSEPEPILVLNVCPGDLVYTECGSGCERTCDNPDPEMCTEECRSGCFCPGFTVRRSTDSDTCFPILMDVGLQVSCQDTEPEPELVLNLCTGDLVYNECGSPCEMTCENPEPRMCISMCQPGCFCPSDTIRLSPDSDTCLPMLMDGAIQGSCPKDESRPCEGERRKKMEESENREGIFIPQCTQDGYYALEQCYEGNGTFCWCADTETGAVKPDTEVHGARADCERFLPDPSLINQCPEGKVFADGVKKCVSVPRKDPESCLLPFVRDENGECVPPTCEGDLVYNMCGSACPDICNEEPAQFCTIQCVLDCACPDGLYRVAGTSRCFAQELCPIPCDEGYKHNENLECVVANPCHEVLAAADEMTSRNMVGVYTPSCTSEGKYQPVQCHGSIGFCWCADMETGLEQEGTKMRGTPECPEPPAPECTGDLVYKECASACPEFCGQSPERAMCIMMCEPGCGCPDNLILESEGGDVCVAAEDCPAPTCEGDLVYNTCGSACPDICNEEPAQFCTFQCVLDCACPDGLYRVAGTSRCLAQDSCPRPCDEGYKHNENLECVVANPCHEVLAAADEKTSRNMVGVYTPSCTSEGKYQPVQCHGSIGFCWCADMETGLEQEGTKMRGTPECPEPPAPECTGDLVYKECASACPEFCGQSPERAMCIMMCEPGCGCPDNLILESEGGDVCVAAEDCPAPACEGDLVYNTCGSACPDICNEEPAQFCTFQCVLDCACPDGLYRVAGTSRCLAQDSCPRPCDEGYKYNENLECVVANPCHEVLAAADEKTSRNMVGVYTPSCTSEGKYQPVQCHGSIGFCWCADMETGLEQEGTKMRGTPECPEPPAPECTGDLVYKECASACPEFCGQSPERAMCIMMCEPGCGCPDNLILESEGGDVCVAAEDCPAQCDNGMVYNECGSPCPDYCGKPEDEVCITMCSPGCFCPEGTLLVDQETQMCVAREDCIIPVVPAAIESPCPTVLDAAPRGYEENICHFKQIFIVKARDDRRTKVLDDLTVTPNRFSVNRPIKLFVAQDECDVQMTGRFMVFMDNEVDAMDRGDIMLDRNDVLVPMTGHFKNRVKEAFNNCPSA